MINIVRNQEINAQLSALYGKYTDSYLAAYISAFEDADPPHRINEFGIIDEERYDADQGILFVAKETNGWSNEDYEAGVLFRTWLKNITQHGLSGHVQRHPIMWYNIGRWASYINDPTQSIPELAEKTPISEIGKLAFTNMNKVRGENQSVGPYWSLAYAEITGNLLREELAIIQPKMIVCCGTYNEFRHHIPDFPGPVIDMPHPGARIRTEKMLEQLASQLPEHKV